MSWLRRFVDGVKSRVVAPERSTMMRVVKEDAKGMYRTPAPMSQPKDYDEAEDPNRMYKIQYYDSNTRRTGENKLAMKMTFDPETSKLVDTQFYDVQMLSQASTHIPVPEWHTDLDKMMDKWDANNLPYMIGRAPRFKHVPLYARERVYDRDRNYRGVPK